MQNRRSARTATWPGPLPLAAPAKLPARPRALIRTSENLGAAKGILVSALMVLPFWIVIAWSMHAFG